MIWQDDLPIEAIVAREMGDEDWEDLAVSQSDDGCYRAKTIEVDPPYRAEPEPDTLKYHALFTH